MSVDLNDPAGVAGHSGLKDWARDGLLVVLVAVLYVIQWSGERFFGWPKRESY